MFQDEGIQIDTDWIDTLNREDKDFLEFHARNTNEVEANQEKNVQKVDENTDKFANQEKTSASDDKDDEWCEVEERPAGVMDTLLQEPDIGQNIDSIISFAPAESNRHLGYLWIKNLNSCHFQLLIAENIDLTTVIVRFLPTIILHANGN